MFQGKPAFLFEEALGFISFKHDVEVDEIIESRNVVYSTNLTIDEVRTKMEEMLPTAYDKLNDVILKFISSSFSLKYAT